MSLYQIVAKVVITTIDLMLVGACAFYADEPKMRKFLVLFILLNTMGVWI